MVTLRELIISNYEYEPEKAKELLQRLSCMRAIAKGEKKMKGMVKYFNQTKGYGFIERNGKKDIFVHISDIKGRQVPSKYQQVVFEMGECRGKPVAVNVDVVPDSKSEGSDSCK